MKPSKTGHSFSQKWSPEVAKGGHTPMPNLLIAHQKDLGVTNGEMVILMDLLMFKWDSKDPYPSVPTLAKSNGMAHQTILRHLRSLEAKHLMRRVFRKATSSE